MKIELNKLEALSELTGIRVEILKFAVGMERKLRENDHKGGWKNCDNDYLRTRLQEEVDELEAMFVKYGKASLRPNMKNKLRRECADVANFALMLSDNLSDETETFI